MEVSIPNATAAEATECGPHSFTNGNNECVPLPAPSSCEAVLIHTMHSAVFVRVSWSSVTLQLDANELDAVGSSIGYAVHYLSGRDSTDVILTASSAKMLTDSFLNLHPLNVAQFDEQSIASVQTVYDFSGQITDSHIVSANNASCPLSIPSRSTPSPTRGLSAALASAATVRFDGPYCRRSENQCGCPAKSLRFESVSEIEGALNESYIVRDPLGYFQSDLSVAVHFCVHRTDDAPPECSDHSNVYGGEQNGSLPQSIASMVSLDAMDLSELDAITMTLNCSLFDDGANGIECGLGPPMEVIFKLVATVGTTLGGGDVVSFYELWWFWTVAVLVLLILFCFLCLFRMVRRQKILDAMLQSAQRELLRKQKENEERAVVHKIKRHAAKSPDYTPNPLGTGVPGSLQWLDPIVQEIEARRADSEVMEAFLNPNDEIFDAFDYRIAMNPTEQGRSSRAKKSNDSRDSSGREMIALDAKGRRKPQSWRVTMQQPLL